MQDIHNIIKQQREEAQETFEQDYEITGEIIDSPIY